MKTFLSRCTLLKPSLKYGSGILNLFLVVALSFNFSHDACAQEVIKALPRWMVSGHINYLVPGEPASNFMDDGSFGYQIEAQYRVQYNKPFLAGLVFQETGLSRYVLKYEDSGTDIKEKANTRRVLIGLTAGFYPEINWLLQPYLQGRIGYTIFQTSSILTDRDDHEVIERISEKTTSVPGYGLDVGIHVVPNIWYLRGDIRIGFDSNPSTSYLLLDEENKGTTGYPIDYFEEHRSAGRWLKISMGLSYMF